jgi:hypothetical protein
MPHPSDRGVSGRLGVPVATCFPMMDHARLSQFAPYKNEVGTSITGSNIRTIGIPEGIRCDVGCQGRMKAGAEDFACRAIWQIRQMDAQPGPCGGCVGAFLPTVLVSLVRGGGLSGSGRRRRSGGRNSGSRTGGRFLCGARLDNVPTPTGRTVARSFSAIFFACRMTSSRSCCSARSNALLAMTFFALDHFRLRIVVWVFGTSGRGNWPCWGPPARYLSPCRAREKSVFDARPLKGRLMSRILRHR